MADRATVLLGVTLILLAIVRVGHGQTPTPGPHEGLPCDTCHVLGPDGEPLVPVVLVQPQEALCGPACHDPAIISDHTGSHPTDFVPVRTLPAEFPLDAQGRFNCGTCHRVHATTPGLLRGDPRSDPCTPCHAGQ